MLLSAQFLLHFCFFQLLFPKAKRVISLNEIENVLSSLELKPKTHFQIGQTMVFLRYTAFHALGDELHKVVCRHVVFLQSRIRGWIARKFFLQQKAAAVKIQSFWRMVECQRVIEDWHYAASIIQVSLRFRVVLARYLLSPWQIF